MIKDLIYKIILLVGLVPATLMLCFSILGLCTIVTSDYIYLKEIILLFSIIFGILGYTGLLTSLLIPEKAKLNFCFLLLGLIGFSVFLSYESGISGWKWLLTMEEPDEWAILGLPNIAALVGLTVNAIRMVKSPKQIVPNKNLTGPHIANNDL